MDTWGIIAVIALCLTLVLLGFSAGYQKGSQDLGFFQRECIELHQANAELQERIETAYDDIENHVYFATQKHSEK